MLAEKRAGRGLTGAHRIAVRYILARSILLLLSARLRVMSRPLDEGDYQRLLQLRTDLRRFLRWSEDQAAQEGLTPAQHQLLLAVRGHADERGPTIGDAAEHLLLRHHSVVGLVDRAVKADLVERAQDDKDHRIVRLRLTPRGLELLERLSALHLEELKRLAPQIREIWPDREPPSGDRMSVTIQETEREKP
jgi:DNA-binding MarR family transcriptional regulator